MQIVIEIDEEVLNKLPEAELGSNVIEDVLEAVENGIILPKGHGDLIDAKRLVEEYPLAFVRDVINDALTIIKADKIEKEYFIGGNINEYK